MVRQNDPAIRSVWRVRFAADETGDWTYIASFRAGAGVATSEDPVAGASGGFFDGDDQNVFPYTTYGERLRRDVSRLEQWEILFAHGESKGMYLHFKAQETENEMLLDNGNAGLPYAHERSLDLAAWTPILTGVADAQGGIAFTDPPLNEPRIFYRLAAP